MATQKDLQVTGKKAAPAKPHKRVGWGVVGLVILALLACGALASLFDREDEGDVMATVEANWTATSISRSGLGAMDLADPTHTPRPTFTRTTRPTEVPTELPSATPLPTDPPPTETSTTAPTETPTIPPPTQPPTATEPPAPTTPPTAAPTQPPTAAPTQAPTSPPAAKVVIAGVFNSGRVEHVEIVNQGGAAQDLGGWAVWGSKGDDRYAFPAGYVLAAGGRVRLHSGQGGVNAPPGDIYWTTDNVWNNDGETVYLANAQGEIVHQYRY